jgi:hypothetical protein
MPEISAAVRALRVRVLEDMAFGANGDRDSRFNEQMKAAVQAELGSPCCTARMRSRTSTSDWRSA